EIIKLKNEIYINQINYINNEQKFKTFEENVEESYKNENIFYGLIGNKTVLNNNMLYHNILSMTEKERECNSATQYVNINIDTYKNKYIQMKNLNKELAHQLNNIYRLILGDEQNKSATTEGKGKGEKNGDEEDNIYIKILNRTKTITKSVNIINDEMSKLNIYNTLNYNNCNDINSNYKKQNSNNNNNVKEDILKNYSNIIVYLNSISVDVLFISTNITLINELIDKNKNNIINQNNLFLIKKELLTDSNEADSVYLNYQRHGSTSNNNQQYIKTPINGNDEQAVHLRPNKSLNRFESILNENNYTKKDVTSVSNYYTHINNFKSVPSGPYTNSNYNIQNNHYHKNNTHLLNYSIKKNVLNTDYLISDKNYLTFNNVENLITFIEICLSSDLVFILCHISKYVNELNAHMRSNNIKNVYTIAFNLINVIDKINNFCNNEHVYTPFLINFVNFFNLINKYLQKIVSITIFFTTGTTTNSNNKKKREINYNEILFKVTSEIYNIKKIIRLILLSFFNFYKTNMIYFTKENMYIPNAQKLNLSNPTMNSNETNNSGSNIDKNDYIKVHKIKGYINSLKASLTKTYSSFDLNKLASQNSIKKMDSWSTIQDFKSTDKLTSFDSLQNKLNYDSSLYQNEFWNNYFESLYDKTDNVLLNSKETIFKKKNSFSKSYTIAGQTMEERKKKKEKKKKINTTQHYDTKHDDIKHYDTQPLELKPSETYRLDSSNYSGEQLSNSNENNSKNKKYNDLKKYKLLKLNENKNSLHNIYTIANNLVIYNYNSHVLPFLISN
ncbi:hypothetical protein HEP_00466800, partial [Hepatocystis sp. ex Piliocolobus tephrosceles]